LNSAEKKGKICSEGKRSVFISFAAGGERDLKQRPASANGGRSHTKKIRGGRRRGNRTFSREGRTKGNQSPGGDKKGKKVGIKSYCGTTLWKEAVALTPRRRGRKACGERGKGGIPRQRWILWVEKKGRNDKVARTEEGGVGGFKPVGTTDADCRLRITEGMGKAKASEKRKKKRA